MDWTTIDWTTTIASAAISLLVATISGWISAKQSYAKEIQKSVYEEREKLYIEIFKLIELLHKSPLLLYNTKKFIEPLRGLNAKVNLYASKEILTIFTPFYHNVLTSWNKYTEMFDSEEAESELYNRKTLLSEEDNMSVERIEYEFEQEAELFMKSHLIAEDELVDILNRLATQIRAELKTE